MKFVGCLVIEKIFCQILLYYGLSAYNLVGKVFANGSEDLDLIPGRVISKTQKWDLMPSYLTLINQGYSGAIQEKESCSTLQLSVVAY